MLGKAHETAYESFFGSGIDKIVNRGKRKKMSWIGVSHVHQFSAV